jgi:hypothetical protein
MTRGAHSSASWPATPKKYRSPRWRAGSPRWASFRIRRHSDRHAGRNLGPKDGPWLTYLRTLQEYGHLFPGFAKEVEGAEEHNGGYQVYCLK